MKPCAVPEGEGQDPELALLGERLRAYGLRLRGGFDFGPEETGPPMQSGAAARSVVLIGNMGGECWPHFQRWRDSQPANFPNPLDHWSRLAIEDAAAGLDATFRSPSDRPFLPFQQWAMRAEGLRPSPLGILIHPHWGLWHAYRGALLFARPLGLPQPGSVQHFCDTCMDKPCLRACPVDAYTPSAFDYPGCLAHVRGPDGGTCRTQGCLDRNACPYGAEHRYPADMQRFIMRAYASL